MGHWYTKTGEAKHWIDRADGKGARDTTLRDAKKLNLLPSVTEIINTLDKPALARWKLAQVTDAIWDFPELNPNDWEDYDQFHKAVMGVAFQKSTEARDRGSEIHNCIEGLIIPSEFVFPDDIHEIAIAAITKIEDYTNTGRGYFTPEQIVVGNGYGGMVDAHNDEFVIDWKTKDIDDPNKKMAWDEQAMQLAAYNKALGPNETITWRRRCINVFIDRTEPGKVVIHEWSPEDIETAWEKFQLLVKYWQLSKNYFPN